MRLYATSALGKIHADTTVRKCLELLPQDKDQDIRTKLADALLGQFAGEGIEPVRQMVQQRAYDPASGDLMGRLVAVSTALGVTFPEHPVWKREAEEKRARQGRRMKELRGFLQAPAKPAVPPEREQPVERKPAPFLRTEKPVGRNDPCPCGSGKKFKKCCMSRGK
jgi:SEC-C motif-containing protein